jgi:hypothetical protein
MDMINYRSQYALMVAEDRMRELHREADLRRRLRGARSQPAPRRDNRRRWSMAAAVGLLEPRREATLAKTTSSPEPL